MSDYTYQFKLKHNEKPSKVNTETGEITPLGNYKNNIPNGKQLFKQDNFSKINNKIIQYLFDNCSKMEIAVVLRMVSLTEYNTNSLKPLSNETSIRTLASDFNISVNSVKKVFKNLYRHGVYAQFSIYKDGEKEYWILNPYISYRGRLIDDALVANFRGTRIERYYNDYR